MKICICVHHINMCFVMFMLLFIVFVVAMYSVMLCIMPRVAF